VLKAAAQQRMAAGQMELGLGLGGPGQSGSLPITCSRMSHLVDATLKEQTRDTAHGSVLAALEVPVPGPSGHQ